MTGLEAYQLYVSIKNHFTVERYDYFLFCGKVGIKQSSYDKRNDKRFFEWLARVDEQPIDKLVAAFCRSDVVYVKDFYEHQDAWDKITLEHKKRVSNLLYWYAEDLKAVPDLWGAMRAEGRGRPRMLQLMSSLKVHPVTASALDACSDCIESWSRTVSDPVVLPAVARRARKLRGFIGLTDLDALRAKLFEVIENQ